MNEFQKLVFTAGQRSHEDLYGATLKFDNIAGQQNIPCTSSQPRKGWILANGQSPETYVFSIKFRRDLIEPANIGFIKKGLNITLSPGDGSTPLALKLDEGGLLPDAQTFDFAAMDRNQHA